MLSCGSESRKRREREERREERRERRAACRWRARQERALRLWFPPPCLLVMVRTEDAVKVWHGVMSVPPLPLVAFVGCPHVHNKLGQFFRAHAPPTNSIGIIEPENAHKLFPPRHLGKYDTTTETTTTSRTENGGDTTPSGSSSGGSGSGGGGGGGESSSGDCGVIKTRWFEKQRKCRPACVALFLDYTKFCGDPTEWQACCHSVDQVVSAARTRKARAIVVVIGGGGSTALPEDRVAAIRRRLDSHPQDPKYVVLCDVEEEEDLKTLHTILHEMAVEYYRAQIQKNTTKTTSSSSSGSGIGSNGSVRQAIKIGTLREFCQDWNGALQAYRSAYDLLADWFSTPGRQTQTKTYLQDTREMLSVAETLMTKIGLLLLMQHNWAVKQEQQESHQTMLHSTPQLQDAIQLFQHHINTFRLPLGRNPSLVKTLEDAYGVDLIEMFDSVHWYWVSYQYKKFAKLLMEHASSSLLQQLGAHPSYYLACAAHYAIIRRQCYESSQSRRVTLRGDDGGSPIRAMFASGACKVTPGEYLGQWEIMADGQDGLKRRLTDTEYLCFLEDTDSKVKHSSSILEHLNSVQVLYEEIGLHRHKLRLQIELADEYIRIDRVEEAQAILLKVAQVYRAEGWESPLADVVLRLRKCAQLLRKTSEHVLHSFELCALENVMEEDQRIAIFQSAQAVLLSQAAEPAPTKTAGALMSNASFIFDMHEREALNTCFSCSIGFKVVGDQMFLGSRVGVLVVLQSKAPLPLEIAALKISFSDPACAIEVCSNSQGISEGEQILEVGNDSKPVVQKSILLNPHEYHKYLFHVTPREIGQLKCTKAEVLLGDSAVLIWDFEKGPSPLASKQDTMKEVGSNPLSRMSGIVPNERGIVIDDLNLGIKVELSVKTVPLADAYTRIEAVVSTEDVKLESCSFVISMEGASDDPEELSAAVDQGIYMIVDESGATVEYKEGGFPLPSMEPHSHLRQEFLVHCSCAKDFMLVAKVVSQDLKKAGDAEAAITLKPSSAFTFECALKSCPYEFPMLFGRLAKSADSVETTAVSVPPNENFLLFATVSSLCSSEIEVLSVEFQGGSGSVDLTYPEGQYEMPCSLSEQESFGLVSYAKVGDAFSGSMGQMKVKWRQSSERYGDLVAETSFGLPSVVVATPPCSVKCSYPTQTTVGEPFPFSIWIENKTPLLQDVQVEMQDEAGFIYGGYKSTLEQVLPFDKNELTWYLVPVATGMMKLPNVKIHSVKHMAELSVPVSSKDIYVRPCNNPQ